VVWSELLGRCNRIRLLYDQSYEEAAYDMHAVMMGHSGQYPNGASA
jgi:hypothetical protein